MFKNKFLSLSTKLFLKKNKVSRTTTGYRMAKNIGIVFTVEGLDKHKAIKAFVKELENEGKNVEVMSYLGKGKDNYEFLFNFISYSDINIWGKIKNEDALKFSEKKFDYLFNIDHIRNRIIENILARSKAKCRIGVYVENNDAFYELMVNSKDNDNPRELIQIMHHYAKKIVVNGE